MFVKTYNMKNRGFDCILIISNVPEFKIRSHWGDSPLEGGG